MTHATVTRWGYCRAEGCGAEINADAFCCDACWQRLPAPLRRTIRWWPARRAWRPAGDVRAADEYWRRFPPPRKVSA